MPHARIRRRRPNAVAAAASFELLERRKLLAAAAVEEHDHGHDHEVPAFVAEQFVPASTSFTLPGGYLTGRKGGDALTLATGFLRGKSQQLGLGRDAAELATPTVAGRYTDERTGVTHLLFLQEHEGLKVINTSAKVSVDKLGRVVAAGSSFADAPAEKGVAAKPTLTAAQAVAGVADELGVALARGVTQTDARGGRATLSAPDLSVKPVDAELAYVAQPDGRMALVWDVSLDLPGGEHWYHLGISAADGRILYADDYVVHATYNVLPAPVRDPLDGPRAAVTDPHLPSASPFGWHDTNGVAGAEFTTTRGNNVNAYLDRDNNNAPDTATTTGSVAPSDGGAALNFDHPLDLTIAPNTPDNQRAAVTNLFYWSNLVHDLTFDYGFNEASGNFQATNYTGATGGGDAVLAEAQDGSGTNNANFAPTPDGTAPRMQMYLFTAANPDRDGDFDNSIVVHEYVHGISNRLTQKTGGGLTQQQARGMGEGWSDFLAILMTMKPSDTANTRRPMSPWALNQDPATGVGIRSFPYSRDLTVNPMTIGLYNSNQAFHYAGTIWAATLWDMTWNLIDAHGRSSSLTGGYQPGDGGDKLALQLVLDAMKLQSANPSFLTARNAILQADQNLTGGANQGRIWQAFARRGMGAGFVSGASTSLSVTQAFDVPSPDPIVNAATPAAGSVSGTPIAEATFTFNQSMDPASFSVVDDVASFTGPGGVDLKSSITGFSWASFTPPGGAAMPNAVLRVQFAAASLEGTYGMTVGPNVLAADNGAPMNTDLDNTSGEAGQDAYSLSFGYTTNYASAPTTIQQPGDLVIGAPGVTTFLNGTDDTAGTLTLPGGATFNFYGQTHSSLWINPNGLLGFGPSAITPNNYTNTDLTAAPTQAVIAPLWDDWHGAVTGTGATDSAVLYRLDGDRLVVEWSDIGARTAAGGSVTFQVILELNTGGRVGRIWFNYVDVVTTVTGTASTATRGGSATVGVKAEGAQTASGLRLLNAFNNAANTVVVDGATYLYAKDVVMPKVSVAGFGIEPAPQFRLLFSEDVRPSLSTADLTLLNRTTGQSYTGAALTLTYDAATQTATVGAAAGLLPDGDYRLTIASAGVTDAQGNALDGNGDGLPLDNFSTDGFVLAGDADRDRTVGFADLLILSANYNQTGRTFTQGDFDYDGTVGFSDLLILSGKYNTTLAAPLTAVPVPATPARDVGRIAGDVLA